MQQYITYLFLLLVSFGEVHSQITLYPKAETNVTRSAPFQVKDFTNNLGSRRVGYVYLADKENTKSLILSENASSYFEKVYRYNFLSEITSDSVTIHIKKLNLTEQKSGAILNGKVVIELAYFSKNGEELLVKVTNSAYERTFGSATATVFQQVIAQVFIRNIDYFNLWLYRNSNHHPALITKSEVIVNLDYLQNIKDTIYYGTRPISWADFTGKPINQHTRFAAAIFPNIAFDLEMKIQNRTLMAYFTPKVYMVQGMSWVKSDALNDYSLEHEKLHFDVAKIAMNRMTKRVKEIKANNPDDLQSQIQFEYLEAYREMNRLQEAYDDETGHGVNQLTQAFWKTQISQWLKE
jgi:hypothetical protein